MKSITFLVLFFSINIIKSNAQKTGQLNNRKDLIQLSQLQLKNYAFCQCLSNIYHEHKDLLINDGSVSAYFQNGKYQIEAYDKIDSMSRRVSKRIYKNIGNHNLGMMKCLDYYNSSELQKLVISLNRDLK